MSHVANVRYPDTKRAANCKIDTQGGTDIEFATIKVARGIGGRTQMVNRDFSFAGTYQNGLQVVEISNPRQPRLVATYDCDLFQGDVQTFARDERTYVTYTNDYDGVDSACFRDLGITGDELPTGTLVIDVTRPSAPRSVGFVEVPAGSHNQTAHPNGRVMYNSNSERTPQGLEVIDLTNLKPPKIASRLQLVSGNEAHDITFSQDGNRAYVAALATR